MLALVIARTHLELLAQFSGYLMAAAELRVSLEVSANACSPTVFLLLCFPVVSNTQIIYRLKAFVTTDIKIDRVKFGS